MKMPYCITIGSDLSFEKKEEVKSILSEVFYEVDQTYNNWNPNSEISRLNANHTQKTTLLSTNLYNFLVQIDYIYRLTEKKFDPTIAPVLLLYRKALEKGKIPHSWEIKKAQELVGWNFVSLLKGFFQKRKQDLQIDLCGIAKGYAIDLITEKLLSAGFSHFMVEWSGDIRAHGSHPTNRPWRIKIYGTDENYTFPLKNLAIATSGDAVHNWRVKDSTYFHIIDTTSKIPLQIQDESIASVSCIAPTCALADALATSAMAFSTADEARIWADRIVKEHPSICFWIITHKKVN